jgi:hypothetical protein
LQLIVVLRHQLGELPGRFSRYINRCAARAFRKVCRGHRQTDTAGRAGQQGVAVLEAPAHR